MAGFSIVKDFQTKTNPAFLEKAAALKPVLIRRKVTPIGLVAVDADGYIHPAAEMTAVEGTVLHKADRMVFDFEDHQVGHVSFDVIPVGSHYDAPAYLRIRFAEMPVELLESSDTYGGWLSKSWIQEETLHLDMLPCTVSLPRRYAFRYMQVEVLDTSPKYGVRLDNVACESVTSAGEPPAPLQSGDELLNRIDAVSVKTLGECMQSVFEDGPKRDRRLWLGDLRLTALANYATFRNNDLVKRCLYLFAGTTFADGRMGACLFHEPEPQVDDTYLMDFALLFCPMLWEYFEATSDRETLAELYPSAMKQIDICLGTMLGEGHVVIDHGEDFWCFLDWGSGLNKQCGAQGALIYALEYGVRLARAMNEATRAEALAEQAGILRRTAKKAFWDEGKGLFVSSGQVSWASQIWMVLAQVLSEEESRNLLHRMDGCDGVKIVTPYLFHYYLEALLKCGEKERVLSELRRYWGGMLEAGADTFWEVYDPEDAQSSPYGSAMVNSYCHAWGCTPSYFLRILFEDV